MSSTVYLGIDVGSVTTKLALVDETGKYVDSVMDSAAAILHQLDQFGPQLEEAASRYAQQDG